MHDIDRCRPVALSIKLCTRLFRLSILHFRLRDHVLARILSCPPSIALLKLSCYPEDTGTGDLQY
jgi:hypothetical protein